MIVLTMSSATSFLVLVENVYSFLFLSKIVIRFVSNPKPAPLSFIEFKIIRSAFFSFNFFNAFSFSSFVSKAKPTNVCLADFLLPASKRMSFVFFKSVKILQTSFLFFYYCLFLENNLQLPLPSQ